MALSGVDEFAPQRFTHLLRIIAQPKERIMRPIPSRFRTSRRALLLSTLALLPAFLPSVAMVQQAPPAASSPFSFTVYGDSRPMMYLPYKEGQPELNQLFVEMFGLVMPERIAEAVVKSDVKMTFDPVTKKLIKVVMPFESKSEVMTLTLFVCCRGDDVFF